MAKSPFNNKNKSRKLDVIDTPEYQAGAAEETKKYRGDFRLFCKDKLTIIDKMAVGDPRVKFVFNDCQEALAKLIDDIGDFNEQRSTRIAERDSRAEISRYPIKICVLKARKVGVSTLLEARGYWKASMFPEQKCLVMAHERPAAQNIANITSRFDTYWDGAADYPIFKVPLTRKSDDLLEWDEEHGSSLVVETAGSKGGGSSRSFTYHFVHMSEVAFFPKDSPQVATALSARAANHETYLESTANGTGNMFYDEWANAMYLEDVVKCFDERKPLPKWWNGSFRFFWAWFQQKENRVFLDEDEEQMLRDSLDAEEMQLIDDHELDLEQIAWRRREIAGPCSKQTAMSPVAYFKQEHPSTPEEAFVSKSSALFDGKKLNAMAVAAKEVKPAFLGFIAHDSTDEAGLKLVPGGQYLVPEHGEALIEGAQFVQWELPNPEEGYVMGIDAAEGLENRDWSVISIFSRTNGTRMREVARLRAKTPARELGEIANYLGLLYNEAYIVAERNAPGNSTCEKLIELGYTNMYHHRNIESVSNHDNPEAFTAGFKTTITTKPMICERGVQGIRDDEIVLRHPDAIREWKMFTRFDRKYGAPEGMNDDTVMVDLLAYFGMSEAPPLHHSQVSTVEPLPKMTSEEAQNFYWTKRIREVKDRIAREYEIKAKLTLARTRMRRSGVNPFN